MNPGTNPNILLLEASKGSGQTDDQGKAAEGVQDKDKVQEKKKTLFEAENKEAASKAKVVEAKGNKVNPKAKDAATFQLSQAVNPPVPKNKM
nr:hypothetical protein CFP56_57455 [Quercus suber]